MIKSFVPKIECDMLENDPSLWFVFQGENILLHNQFLTSKIPLLTDINLLNLPVTQKFYMGTYNSIHCFVVQVNQNLNVTLPTEMEFQHIRQAHATLADEDIFKIITRAKELLHWNECTQFCGYCGKKTNLSLLEQAK